MLHGVQSLRLLCCISIISACFTYAIDTRPVYTRDTSWWSSLPSTRVGCCTAAVVGGALAIVAGRTACTGRIPCISLSQHISHIRPFVHHASSTTRIGAGVTAVFAALYSFFAGCKAVIGTRGYGWRSH